MNNSRVLIVGSNGYLGSHLASKLLELRYDIILADVGSESVIPNTNYTQIDFTNRTDISAVLDDIDFIYFFAGRTGNSMEGFDCADSFIERNEITLVNLLNSIRGLDKKPKIIFPSSRLVYSGNKKDPINEQSELSPKSIYGINKLACEKFIRLFHRNFNIPYSIFRISLPYGNFVHQNHVSYGVMSFLLNRAENGHTLKIYGDGNQIGSFIHIHDLVELLIIGGMNDKTDNDTFNIGGPDHLPMADVIKAIAKLFNVQVEKVPWPQISKNTDSGNLIIDTSKLLKLLDYKYKFTFEKWLKTIEH